MFHLSLTACSFMIKKKNSRSQDNAFFLNAPMEGRFENESYAFRDAGELFAAFFTDSASMRKDRYRQQTFSCEYEPDASFDTEDFRLLYTKIQSGTYGSSSDIVDSDTQRVKFNKSSKDIDLRPFYLAVILPKDSDAVRVQKGMFLFQNVGPYGVKTITTDYMQAYFSARYGISLKCSTIAPGLFVKKVIRHDSIKKLVMVKNLKSADRADNLDLGYGKEVREIADLRLSVPVWERLYHKIQWVAKGRENVFEFENKRYDTLKVIVDVGGRNRTIDLHNLDNLSIIEAVPEDIRMPDGHPDRDRLLEHFQQVALEYLQEMVLQIS